jgi:hypothetical protein
VVRNELDVWLVDATVKADQISAEGQGKTAKKQSRHSRFHEGNAWRDSAAPDVEAARKGTLPRITNRPAPRILLIELTYSGTNLAINFGSFNSCSIIWRTCCCTACNCHRHSGQRCLHITMGGLPC